MSRNVPGYLLLVLLMTAMSAAAQKADSLKKDSVKIDTAILNRYHIEPKKNSLPVRTRVIQIERENIPVNLIDYKMNYWRKWITLSINFNQSAFSNNFAAGGANAIAVNGSFEYKSEYHKGSFDYVPDLIFRYAKSKNKGQGPRKTDDYLFFDNKVATQLSKSWFFFGSLTFQSQFDKGYNYDAPDYLSGLKPALISRFLAPGYLTESLGFEYKPNNWYDLRIGTGTARQTFMIDTTVYHNNGGNNNNVPIHKTFHNDLAFQLVTTVIKPLDKKNKININVRYQLFVPYQENIKFTSHRIDGTLTAQVTRLFGVSFNSTFIYDKSQKPGPQGSEGLGMGINYRFPN